MTEELLPESTEKENKWYRLIFTLLFFVVVFWLVELVCGVVVLIQLVLHLFNAEPNPRLRVFSKNLTEFVNQALLYITFCSDEAPYPFQNWPEKDHEDEI